MKNSFAAAIMLIITGCSTITTVAYPLTTARFIPSTSLTIVHISDLHSTIYKDEQQALIQKIIDAHPDIIALTGDIVDDVRPVLGTRLLLEGIRDVAPIYYVSGNHEYMSGNIQRIYDTLRYYGVTVLSDTYITLNINGNDVVLAGLEDPSKSRYEPFEYNQDEILPYLFGDITDTQVYKILLAHRPERIKKYLDYHFDLILSGHTHGGQVRLPLINGLYAPMQGIFPKYGGGLYKHKESTHIISRGLSVFPLLPRVANPPELVVVTVRSSQ